MVSTLAMTDTRTKLLIEKGVITDQEFKAKLSAERATYPTGSYEKPCDNIINCPATRHASAG
jgi:hypothetical protein